MKHLLLLSTLILQLGNACSSQLSFALFDLSTAQVILEEKSTQVAVDSVAKNALHAGSLILADSKATTASDQNLETKLLALLTAPETKNSALFQTILSSENSGEKRLNTSRVTASELARDVSNVVSVYENALKTVSDRLQIPLWLESSESGWHGVFYSENKLSEQDLRRYLIVVLNAPHRKALEKVAREQIIKGNLEFEVITLINSEQTVAEIPVFKGSRPHLELTVNNNILISIPRERFMQEGRSALNLQLRRPDPITAPITRGTPLGEILIFFDGTLLRRVPCTVAKTVEEGSFLRRFIDTIRLALLIEDQQ